MATDINIPNKTLIGPYDYHFLRADKKLLDYYKSALNNKQNKKDRTKLKESYEELTAQNDQDGYLTLTFDDVSFLCECLNGKSLPGARVIILLK